MKKLVVFCLVFICVLGFSGCGGPSRAEYIQALWDFESTVEGCYSAADDLYDFYSSVRSAALSAYTDVPAAISDAYSRGGNRRAEVNAARDRADKAFQSLAEVPKDDDLANCYQLALAYYEALQAYAAISEQGSDEIIAALTAERDLSSAYFDRALAFIGAIPEQ